MDLLALTVAAFAQSVAAEPITVTGQRIPNLEAQLTQCVRRGCPADEDIDATLALAEAQILNGDYKQSRATLLASLRRNKRFAERYPIPVSDLYRANGRVAAHMGLDSDYYRSTWGIYQTLKRGLPGDKVRQYYALMEVADMVGRTRGHERARQSYDAVIAKASREGLPAIAAMAKLRALIRHYPPGAIRDRGIEAIASSSDPAIRPAAIEAKIALARIAFEAGDIARGEALAAELVPFAKDKPILVFVPAIAVANFEISGQEGLPHVVPASPGWGGAAGLRAPTSPMGTLSTTKRLPRNYDDDWIDVSFVISPKGDVTELEIKSKQANPGWAGDLIQSIKGRRYSPLRAGDPAAARRERYTYTAGWEAATGTRMLQRSPQARIEFFDLTGDGSIGNVL